MQKKKHAFQNPERSYPDFVGTVTEATRRMATNDGVITLKVDNSARSVICFTGRWLGNDNSQSNRMMHRMVYLETKKTEEGFYSVVFMPKPFDPNSVNHNYTEEQFSKIPKDIMNYLRSSIVPT